MDAESEDTGKSPQLEVRLAPLSRSEVDAHP